LSASFALSNLLPPSRAVFALDGWRERATASHTLSPTDLALAGTLIRDFSTKLAAADALHLAATINAGTTLVTFDERMVEVALSRGVRVETLA
jgi:predicted nucleic acid-binding protein